MPRTLNGRKLTLKEHRQWKKVRNSTGSAAAATAAVQKTRRKRK